MKGSPRTSRDAGDVGGDRRRVGDHLVLEARVELHVADLVDQLGREEAALLLVVLGQDQAENWVEIRSSATISELSAK